MDIFIVTKIKIHTSTIKKLQEEFHVKIFIPKREDESSIVEVAGTPSDVDNCQKEIENILGFSGSGGVTIKKIESGAQCTVHVPSKGDESNIVTINGTEDNAKKCRTMIEEIVGTKLKVVSAGEENKPKKKLELDLSQPINEALFFPHHINPEIDSYDRFIQYLASPKKTMDVCVFTITDDKVSELLIDNQKRGVKVRVITDDDTSASQGSDIELLKSVGIPVKVDSSPFFMHNKYTVIDGELLLSGSYNWTSGAHLKNNENIIITNNKIIVEQFQKYFDDLWSKFK